jgi:hypothetical protein
LSIFSAFSIVRGKAKNSARLPMTASTLGAGVFRGFVGGGVSSCSQERENAAPGITQSQEWLPLPA